MQAVLYLYSVADRVVKVGCSRPKEAVYCPVFKETTLNNKTGCNIKPHSIKTC
jgi:hypothetical protein